MMSSRYFRIVLNAALILLGVFFIALGRSSVSQALEWVSYVGAIVSFGGFVFENFLWRWSWLQRWSWFPVPDLNGTWKGTLISSFIHPDGTKVGPIEAYIVVRQSFLNVSVRQFTAESASSTLSGSVTSDPDGVKRLEVMYFNFPDLRYQPVSRAHHGSFSYCIEGQPASALAGRYWTDRGTYGDTRFSERVPQRADNYEHAREMFLTNAPGLPAPVGTDSLEEAQP